MDVGLWLWKLEKIFASPILRLPKVLPNVKRNLSHCLNVALEGSFPSGLPPPPMVDTPGALPRVRYGYAVREKDYYVIRHDHDGLLPLQFSLKPQRPT